MRRVFGLAVLIAIAVAGCGSSAHNGQQVSGTIRALELRYGKPSGKHCNANGSGESCVLTWPGHVTIEATSGGAGSHHSQIVVVKG
jgi:hypothetical protein